MFFERKNDKFSSWKKNVFFLLKINVGNLDTRTEYRGQLVLQVHNLCWILIGLRTGTVLRYFAKYLCCTQFACRRKHEQFAPFAWNLFNWIPRKLLRKLREMQIQILNYSCDKAVYMTCTKNKCLHFLLKRYLKVQNSEKLSI